MNDELQSVKKSESANITSEFNEVESFFNEFKVMLSGTTDHEVASELHKGIADVYERCCLLYDKFRSRSNESKLDYDLDMLATTDSASHMAEHVSVTSSRVRAQQIELESQRTELRAMCYLEKEQAKARAKVVASEAETRFRIAQAKLDAEERLLSLSQKGSTLSGASRKSRRGYHGFTDATHARGKLHHGALTDDADKKQRGSGSSLALGARVVKFPPRLSGSTHVDRLTGVKLAVSHRVATVSSLLRTEGIHPKTEVGSRDGRVNIRQEFRPADGSHPDLRLNSYREGDLILLLITALIGAHQEIFERELQSKKRSSGSIVCL